MPQNSITMAVTSKRTERTIHTRLTETHAWLKRRQMGDEE